MISDSNADAERRLSKAELCKQYGHILYRAVGQSDPPAVDLTTRELPKESWLLVCSDGLWNLVNDQELHAITTTMDDPQAVCERQVALAKSRGGADNITVIVLKMDHAE
jgi:serine/threonine protein phosphatase PrpC